MDDPDAARAAEDYLTSSRVAALLRMSKSRVLEIPKDELDYWTTPGGKRGGPGHRRYTLAAVVAWAAQHQGRTIRL